MVPHIPTSISRCVMGGPPTTAYRPMPASASCCGPDSATRTVTGSRTCQYLPQSGAVAAHRASTTSWPRRENPRQAPPPSRHEPSRSAARIIRRGRHRPPRADRHNDYLSGMPHGQHSGYASLSAPTVTERGHTHSDATTKTLAITGFPGCVTLCGHTQRDTTRLTVTQNDRDGPPPARQNNNAAWAPVGSPWRGLDCPTTAPPSRNPRAA